MNGICLLLPVSHLVVVLSGVLVIRNLVNAHMLLEEARGMWSCWRQDSWGRESDKFFSAPTEQRRWEASRRMRPLRSPRDCLRSL